MLSEILIGIGCFLLGGVCGSLYIAHMLKKVNEIYKADTGNDFVTWVLNKDKELKKTKKESEKPILEIEIKNED